ncbi:MAG: hypothetical protein IH789_12055 [Acidobacteria bacterium]|nr:hypothetical protein [Acidobacteriota bacterium]
MATLPQFKEEIDAFFTNDIASLTNLYISIRLHEVESMWGWTNWREFKEGAVWAGDPFAKLTEYYCYLIVKRAQGLTNDQITHLQLSADRDFLHQIGAGSVATTLSDYVDNRQKWGAVIPEDWLRVIPPIKELFARTIKARDRADEDRLIASELSKNKVAKFKESVVQHFSKDATLRSLFKQFDAYRDESNLPFTAKGIPKWGFNLLDDKAAYVDGWHTEYLDWGEHYGRDLATSENEVAFSEVLKGTHACTAAGGDSLEERILTALHELEAGGTQATLILAGLSIPYQLIVQRSRRFVPHWELKNAPRDRGFEGFFDLDGRKIPIYEIWTRGEEERNGVCALDIQKAFQWVQMSPINDESEMGSLHELFYFRILDLANNQDTRRDMLDRTPHIREQHPDDPHRHLSLKVWLQIFERFEIRTLNAQAARKFTFRAAQL